MSKIPFRAVYCSSEDPEFPMAELNVHSPQTKGWQSARHCDYPQELGFQLEEECRISQIQILSHQAKIAARMEVFIGVGADYATATFKRLGYLSLDSNQRSNYQARELKSVYINACGNFIKLLISRCHTNYSNVYCQVGIVALNVLGQPLAELPDADAAHAQHAPAMAARPHDTQLRVPAHQQHATLTPHQSIQQAIARGSGDLAIDLSFDPATADRLRTLANAKSKAVKEEDYALAKQIKVAETELRELGLKLAELDAAKNEAVRVEDYDQAKLLKDEVESLRKQIDNKFKEINIPGLNLEERAIGGRHISEEPRGRRDRSPPPVHAPAKEAARSPSPPISSQAALSQSVRAEMLDERPISGVKAQQDEDDVPDRFKDRVDSARSRPRSRPSMAREEQPIAPTYTAQEKERFPPGAHPLEGVPNLEELDNPEPLAGSQSKDSSGLAPLIHLFGEYRVRCFLSKTWNLRDAFFVKARLMLPELRNSPGLQAALPTIIDTVKAGLDDKIAQVFFSCVSLVEALLGELAAEGASRTQVGPMFDGVIQRLLGKLADGQVRVRDASSQALLNIAASPVVGPHSVGLQATRALPAKLKNAWRAIVSRLKLVQALAEVHGLGGHSGLSVDSVMDFVKSCNGFAHSNGEVRDAARDLTVVLYTLVGDEVQRHLTGLRPKQAKEYADAFTAALAGGGGVGGHSSGVGHGSRSPAAPPVHSARSAAAAAPPSNQYGHQQRTTHSPPRDHRGAGAKEVYSPDRYPGAGADHDDSQEDPNTMCMFCGVHNDTWDEDALDLHYWRECPMLQACPACSQIVEIAALADHLTTECEHKDQYVIDEVSGLAIPRAELKSWRAGPYCKPVQDGCAICPLCFTSIVDSEDSWKHHLSNDCGSNTRLRQS